MSDNERHVRAGQAITGWGADRIVVDNAEAVLTEQGARWLAETVRPRLYPGGEVVLRFTP